MATPNFPYPKTPPKITIKIILKKKNNIEDKNNNQGAFTIRSLVPPKPRKCRRYSFLQVSWQRH